MHKMHQQIQLISRVLVIIVVFFFFPVATSCAGKKCPAVTQNSDSMAVLISEDKWEKKTKGVALSTSGSNIGMLLFWDEENASKYSRLALDTGGWVVTASSIDNNIVRLVFAYNGDKALSCESIFKTDDFGYQEYYIQCANDNAIHYLMVQIGTGERSRDSIELISRVKHGTVYLCGPVVPCKNSADVQ